MELEVRCNGKTLTFPSNIVLINNNSVLINAITVNDQTIGFTDNCQLNFLYKSESKLFIWENVNIKLVKYDGAICHQVDLSGVGKPFNRRNSYRMYVGEDMPLFVNTATGPCALSVLIKDISETGTGFITKDDIDIDRTIRLKLKDNNLTISISGIIVRKEYLENLGAFHYGCKFNEKNNLLSKYIVKKQNEELKKKSGVYTPLNVHDKKHKNKNKVMQDVK
ncbi:MAG: PilZ domain-containing protein [Mobilitalea sp.]